MSYILSIDQGTTGTTALLINTKNFEIIKKVNLEFEQIFPKPGWVEHNLDTIWNSVRQSVSRVITESGIRPKDIISIGITNQRETTCAFNRAGQQLHNAIVWQDRRTGEYCHKIKKTKREKIIKEKSGLTVDPYFSASKINWLLNNSKKVQTALENNDLLIGTVDVFLLYKLTNSKSFLTEATNASRTMLVNLKTSDWDDELLDIFEVPRNILPNIQDSFGHFGKTEGLDFLPDGIPINCILGDQQSALFGQGGYQESSMKCTYGTGAFVLLNIGQNIVYSKSGLLTTIAYRYKGQSFYALEGSCYIAGAAVQWLRDNLNIITHSSETEKIAEKINNLEETRNIFFLPFFTGIGSPHWNSEAKAAILGLSRDSNKSHIVKACLEGIAFSINDLLTAMCEDSKIKIESLKVDGGACANNFLMGLQSTISNTRIIRPKNIETTAYGTALGAAIGLELIDFHDIEKYWKEDLVFSPNTDQIDYYTEKKNAWSHYIKKIY